VPRQDAADAARSSQQTPAYDDTATDAGAQCQAHHVVTPAPGAVTPLTQRIHTRVILDDDGASQLPRDDRGQRPADQTDQPLLDVQDDAALRSDDTLHADPDGGNVVLVPKTASQAQLAGEHIRAVPAVVRGFDQQ
jgi:hypothetical protein